MKIGILGVGNIGGTLAKSLSASGHDVKIANSRGPETIDTTLLANGAHAVDADDAITDVEVLILFVPLKSIPDLKAKLATLADDVVVIDTSNYYPSDDFRIAALDDGQTEAEWSAEQLGRPIVKAWNAILAAVLQSHAKPAGSSDRIAVPVTGDRSQDREIAMKLVDDSGYDAFDAGALSESWRQQPGGPAYCTALTLDEIKPAWEATLRDRLPARRDLAMAVVQERFAHPSPAPDSDMVLRIVRAVSL